MSIQTPVRSSVFLEDPHHFLGVQAMSDAKKVIRLYRPGASHVHLEVLGKGVEAVKKGDEGFFEVEVPSSVQFADYRIYHQSGRLAHDPYAFLPSVGEMDLHLFAKGVHYRLYEMMGGRLFTHQGIEGVKFAVWAPNATGVAVVGDFNFWDGRLCPMRRMQGTGVWELFVPGLKEGEKYKFEVRTQEGHILLKADPFALKTEYRPQNASVIACIDRFSFTDAEWFEQRRRQGKETLAMNIYEVHLGSWKKRGGHFLNYREIAHELAHYCLEMGFTHVELMPIAEHPLDESWGYQVTGFYAATSRFGSPEDFQYFVNHMHQEGIGVILDWVPAHFPTDGHSLAQFDGSYLFEHEDPRQGFHPHWNTYIFNYGRKEVTNFLIASALFWLDKMHVDGLRVDAVASMLYLDYGRKEGEWIPNAYGRNENLEAIEFLKHMNAIVHQYFPHAWMCAEESSSFLGVTHPLEQGGLGFDLKWNMGWMNDTLRYFHKAPIYRSYHQNDLTFALMYAFSERYILPLSHDEVVHGKASLLSKMPEDDWQKFASLRLLYSYQMCQPGKKLIFMGAELGQWTEWNCKEPLPWELLQHERHRQNYRFFKEINHFYLEHSALWERDFSGEGFEWVDCTDRKNATISYLRKASGALLLCLHNFTPHFIPQYFLRLVNVTSLEEVFNSDREEYGGSGKINSSVDIIYDEHSRGRGVHLQLSPLATMIFEVHFAI